MIALDTNVLARFVVADDPAQSAAATTLIDSLSEAEPGYVSREVLIELVWLLGSVYAMPRAAIGGVVDRLLRSSTLIVEADEDVVQALNIYQAGPGDFADLMILAAARRAGCETLYTFDGRLARQDGATLVGAT